MAARLSDFLVHDGALPVETVRVAVARQIVYGGALDTALLEMDALAEATIWHELSHASGLPIPDPDLVHASNPAASAEFDAVRSERCRAVPVGRRGNRLQLLCGDPIEREALREVSAELALDLELYVVPEVRLQDGAPDRLRTAGAAAVRAPAGARARPRVGAPLGAGAREGARQRQRDRAGRRRRRARQVTETALVVRAPAVDETEALCRLAADVHAAGRIGALHELRERLEHPRVRELAASFRADAANGSPERALGAVVAITELRDRLAVPVLIDLVDAKDARAGRRRAPGADRDHQAGLRQAPAALAQLAGGARPGGAHRVAVRRAWPPRARDPLRLVGGAVEDHRRVLRLPPRVAQARARRGARPLARTGGWSTGHTSVSTRSAYRLARRRKTG